MGESWKCCVALGRSVSLSGPQVLNLYNKEADNPCPLSTLQQISLTALNFL